MTRHQDEATGTVTGSIPAEPPTCKCCGDEFAEMIDIRELSSEEPEWFCRDIGPCMQRQALAEAAKNRFDPNARPYIIPPDESEPAS